MWVDGEDIHADWEMVCHLKVAIAGRDIEGSIMLQLEEHRKQCWGLGSEIEADRGLDAFRFSLGLQMQVENQIRAGVETPAHPLRFGLEHRTGFPKQEMGIRVEHIRAALSGDVHTWKTRLAIFTVPLP